MPSPRKDPPRLTPPHPLSYPFTTPAGVGFTLINPSTKLTTVNIAQQQDPSYGPIMQLGGRFGDYAGIDMHPISGRIWSANPYVWAPAYAVDGTTVISNAGARITIFS